MPSRKISDCHLLLQPKLRKFLTVCTSESIDILVTCTWRSFEEQAELYASGRTKPGRILTMAKPGQSRHNFMANGRPASLAFDVVPLRLGKPVWGTAGNGIDDDPTDDDKDDLELWQRVGAIGESCGLDWAGRWKRFREFPHFEIAVPR